VTAYEPGESTGGDGARLLGRKERSATVRNHKGLPVQREAAFSAEDDVLPHKSKPGLRIKLPRPEAPHLERLETRVLATPRSPGGARERRPSSAEFGEALHTGTI